MSVRAAVDVVLQLRDERLDAVELALAAQEVDEPHLGPLAVEVAVEVEQVGLEQRVVGVLVERRPPAEVDRRTGARAPSGRSYQPAYTPSAGRQIVVRHLDVGRREAEQAAALVAVDHDDARAASNGRPSIVVGELDVAAGEGPADRRWS